MIARIARDSALACAGLALVFFMWRGPLAGFGVVGGGLLIGLSFRAIYGAVNRGISSKFALVKFFTRHVILALAAYGMMVRLHLDPVALLAGVSSLGVAVAVEALRDLRWRRFL